jgi:hypothetical protein
MRGPTRSILLAALAVCGLAAATASQASAANMKENGAAEGFLAIYGSPGTNGTTVPVGGGLGRNFGFSENLLFRASTGAGVGTNLSITIAGVMLTAKDSFLGATLMSNKTGVDAPLSFTTQFADFQFSEAVGLGAMPTYADTFDRTWIGEICSAKALKGKCKVDPRAGTENNQGAEPGEVKIEDVSFDVVIGGATNVIQGTVWGKWIDGAAGTAPCIELHLPPSALAALTSQTLVGTQGATVLGKAITAISGKACLISANNNWYKIKSGEEKTPQIEIENA